MSSADSVRLLATAALDAGTDLVAAAAEGRTDVQVQLIDPRWPDRPAAAVPLPHGEEVFALAAAPLDRGGAAVCAVGDGELSVWVIDPDGAPVLAGRASTEEEPTDHLVVLTAGRAQPVVVRAAPRVSA